MIYLDNFILPDIRTEEGLVDQSIDMWQMGHSQNRYPCEIFTLKQLSRLDFGELTILYGGNGSGKSTLLNLIAQKLQLQRLAPFNSSLIFDKYTNSCTFAMAYDENNEKCKLPPDSKIITSDDVFDFMLNVRTNNTDIANQVEKARQHRNELAFAETIKLKSMSDYDALRQQLFARKITARQYALQTVGESVSLRSNGETALRFFEEKLGNDSLYLLDEPENSMSPKFQIELTKTLQSLVRYCGNQLIIATHSPFILAIEGAKIYDLDSTPVDIKNWWELEMPRLYYEFFKKHAHLFEK